MHIKNIAVTIQVFILFALSNMLSKASVNAAINTTEPNNDSITWGFCDQLLTNRQEGLINYNEFYAERKEYEKMNAILKKALRYSPQQEQASSQDFFEIPRLEKDLGDAYFSAGEYQKAKELYKLAFKLCRGILKNISPDWDSYANVTALAKELAGKIDETLIKLGQYQEIGFCANPYSAGGIQVLFNQERAPVFIDNNVTKYFQPLLLGR